MSIIQAFFSVKLPFKLTKKRKWVVAFCPVLDIYSQGDTEEKARRNLKEAISAFLISCVERNTLDKVFKDCGFELATSEEFKVEKKSSSAAVHHDYINVPIPFVVNPHHSQSCHA